MGVATISDVEFKLCHKNYIFHEIDLKFYTFFVKIWLFLYDCGISILS